ncbi:GntR family transcriptional regulator [Chelatococcus asaccharovorans]|uniref:GntR family transcriptional regulator n=1 Tax=Chelatococcus asaccharovorans TaxID=28210 RepID=A0A2V3UFJ3_9HYPH|nr:GntR family transcriptional regulator [Chelatococcus asaccharovorans]MBS7707329.1 GntR family transcriptional regulator [Chelatococcus asaccharovorans]PXW63511.1 GntR family transcriptional regulator [Chelatococcus asaccharovorans]CAH1650920.1 GntR family transcriptional regulator [Chelatococcus asaccharovorans]CAH1692628.1 GntR family transcriptional regulator [Chelatococcus asaccharovorans]
MSEHLLAGVVTPIARQSNLGELTYARLKEIIVAGSFPPNEKLTVRSVAAALGVSTTPARDAINRLLSEGALVNEGPKTVVIPSLTLDALDEVTATRLALEGLAAERSVLAAAPADVTALELMQAAINSGLDAADYREVLKVNREFHFLIYRLSGWPRLVAMIESLWLRVGPSLNELYPDFAQNRRGVSNHMAAIDGLRAKDGAKVRFAMEQDIRDGYVRLKAMITSRG